MFPTKLSLCHLDVLWKHPVTKEQETGRKTLRRVPAAVSGVRARCWRNHCFPFHADNGLAGKAYSPLRTDWGEPRKERKADKQWENLTSRDKLIKLCVFGLANRRWREDRSLERRQRTCSDETGPDPNQLSGLAALWFWSGFQASTQKDLKAITKADSFPTPRAISNIHVTSFPETECLSWQN